MSRKAIVMAFVALATTAATPALAGEPFMRDHPSDACKAEVRGALYARGADIKGFAHEGSGYGQWPRDIVIECLGDRPARGAL
jgi:hypothetical protein